ncbi:U3 small nucleolar RNA-associated protein 15 homolog [Glandiceps talaboti]
MAASYKKTPILQAPSGVGGEFTRDTIYWQNLEFPVTIKEFGAVSHIEFSPTEPHHFAVTSASRVQIYSPQTNQILKGITRFKGTAYCGSFRGDGKLIVAGGEEGLIRLFDVGYGGRTILRTFRGHEGAVHVSKFSSDNLHIMSCSDDNTVKYWDIASESEVTSFGEHKDYIRTGVVSTTSKDLLLTGSYDHTAKLFDVRTEASLLTVDHGQPVDAVLMFPNSNMFLTAGGTVIKVWDVLSGGRLLATFGSHHKTVTSLCFNSTNDRLLAGSLDRHVKVYDLTTYKTVHSLSYPGAVLSVALSPDENTVAVGMADGLLSIQHRKTESTQEEKGIKSSTKSKNYRYFLQHKPVYRPVQDDLVVKHDRRERLAKYDKHLKKFEYSKALDTVLSDKMMRSKSPGVIVSVFQELIRRNGLRIAVSGRDEKWLQLMLSFLYKHITSGKYTNTLLDVTNLVIEIYSSIVSQSPELVTQFESLHNKIDKELKYQESLFEVMGVLDVIFASSFSPASNSVTMETVTMSENDTAESVTTR